MTVLLDKRQYFFCKYTCLAAKIMIGVNADDGIKIVLRKGHIHSVSMDRYDLVFKPVIPYSHKVFRCGNPEIESIDIFCIRFIGNKQ